MTPRTKAGRAHPVWPGGPPCAESCPGDWSEYHDGFAWGRETGEREAAQQERERIRAAVTAYDYWATRDVNDHMAAPEEMQADILAILAEPSEPKPSTITQTNEPPTRSTWDPRR